jgi:hypothetical protein
MSAAQEMQKERHHGRDEKNMNQPARHMKNNPAKNPGNQQNQERYHEDTHKTSRTAGIRGGEQRSRSPLHYALGQLAVT